MSELNNITIFIIMAEPASESVDEKQWFVLRDLTRPIAKLPGHLRVQQAGLEVFTPMKWVVSDRQGKKVRKLTPVIHDLLFVHATKEELTPLINKTDTLQFRYLKGKGYCVPMTVRDKDMGRFIEAVKATDSPQYYTPSELTALSYGKKVRLICDGVMNGYEGKLLSVKGSRKKRLIIEVPGILAVVYEVSPDFIQFV